MPATGNYPDYYPEIPSSVMELKDGVKNIQSNQLDGKKIVLVGTAADGPVMEPVNVSSYDNAEAIFGKYYDKATGTFNGATLMRGLARVLSAGADNVDLLRVSGQHAEAEIDLYEELKTKQYQEREYGGRYPGNVTTEFDLEDTAADGYDDFYITSVGVVGDGTPLDSYAYRVDSEGGNVIINQDATNSLADIEITYTKVSVVTETVTDEELTSQTENYIEFMLEENNVLEDTVEIDVTYQDSTDTEATETITSTDFSVDEESGLITLNDSLTNLVTDIESEDDIDSLLATYDYEDLFDSEEIFEGEADGSDFFIDLDNSAVPSEPIVVTIGGEEIDPGNYSISYLDEGTSRIFVQPGVADLNAETYVRYYWSKEEYVQPSIDVESIFGGEIYNKVNFEIKDTFYTNESDSRTTDVTDETPQIIDSETIRLKNDYIVPDSIALEDGEGTEITFGDVNYAKGIIHLDSSLADTDIVANYEYYNVETNIVTLDIPREKRQQQEAIEVVISDRISTVGELVSEINNHPENNVVELNIPEEYVGISAMELATPDTKIDSDGNVNTKKIRLRYGEDGINISKEEMYELLGGEGDMPGAYDILAEDETVDIVLPLGVYADDELSSQYKAFDQQLANFCARSFYHNNEIRGIIGLKPLQDTTRINIINRVNELIDMNTNYYLTDDNYNYVLDDGERVDIGRFISLVAHDLIYGDGNLATRSIESGAPAYAGTVSMIGGTNSPTNEVLEGGVLAYDYSSTQANNLAGNKLVTFKNRGGLPRVTSAVVCAQPGSGWTRYHTVDIVFDVISDLRNVYDRYIGEGNTLEKRNSLDSDIRKVLKNANTIVDFDYSIVQNPTDKLMGRMIVELDIVPIGELQKVHTTISINAQLD